jgi:ketosteroid isomerase-like protein
MSQENVRVLLLLVEAFNRGDFDDGMKHMDPEVELNPGVLAPDQDTRFLGRQGVMDFLGGATEIWESVSVDRKEIVEGDGERFLAGDQWFFRGRDGIEIERELPTVYTFHNGLIVRIDGFTTKAAAVEAAGLEDVT